MNIKSGESFSVSEEDIRCAQKLTASFYDAVIQRADPKFVRRKTLETRCTILIHAARCMHESADNSWRLDDVAQQCAMTTPSLYHHFKDKNDLIKALFDASTQQLIDGFQQVCQYVEDNEINPVQAIMLYTMVFYETTKTSPGLRVMVEKITEGYAVSLMNSSGRLDEVINLIEIQLQEGRKQGLFSKNLDLYLSASALCGVCLFTLAHESFNEPDNHGIKHFTNFVMNFIFGGLLPLQD